MINVAFLSTWGSKCGISTYSEELCECLIDTGEVRIQVVAPMEEDSCMSPPERIPYRLIWNRNDPNLPVSIPPAVKDCDIVHVQHEYGLFRHHESFVQLLKFLRRDGIKTVVTLHTVFPYGTWQAGVIDSIRSNADMLITHTPEAFAAISLARGKGMVARIPHGTRVNVRPGNRETGFEFLGIPKTFHGASFGGAIGFLGPGKNVQETIKAWAEGVNRGLINPSRSGLIICGDVDEKVFFYREILENHKRDCGYAENIFLVPKFIPREQMRHVMATLDYAVLNTTSQTLSASGQVHALAAHGVPFCAAERPIYRDAINAGAIPFSLGAENAYTIMTVNAIAALANSNTQMEMDMLGALKAYVKETGWPVQAKRHVSLYKELLA
jgi:glycosyltransferase involved in cell wall biosynthesis